MIDLLGCWAGIRWQQERERELPLDRTSLTAARLIADAYAAEAIDFVEMDRTASAIANSEVAEKLVALGFVMPWPEKAVFVYWNATTLECDGCGERRHISRVHLINRVVPVMEESDRGQHRSSRLCRPCVDELHDLTGLVWR